MTPTALHSETIDIAPFLSISRKYLGLNSADGAGAEVALNPFKRQALTSRTKSNTRRNGMKRYCNLAQSLLLATGLGAVVSSPAFADPGCGNMSRREAHFEHHAKMIEQRHQQLHDALKLSAEQEPGWKKFAESEQLKPPPGIDQPEDWSKL